MKIEDLFNRVLVFAAHPDDEIIGCGATIARLSKAAKAVYVVTYTYGATAARSKEEQDKMKQKREKETAATDEILGIKERVISDKPSQGVTNDRGTYQETIRLIRYYRPDLILTHSKDTHKDHNAIKGIVPGAAYQAAEEIMEKQLGKRWHTPNVWLFEIITGFDEYSFCVDITDTFDQKMTAMKAQVSQQRTDFLSSLMQRITGRALMRGADIGVKYGEAFKKIDTYPTPL
jgi:LmbE family N-acetylglucosaminyl deacetylase